MEPVAEPGIAITSGASQGTSLSQQSIQPAVNDAAWETARSRLRDAIARFAGWVRSLGPYAAIELILPGGSIIAVALWTYRHRRTLRRSATMRPNGRGMGSPGLSGERALRGKQIVAGLRMLRVTLGRDTCCARKSPIAATCAVNSAGSSCRT